MHHPTDSSAQRHRVSSALALAPSTGPLLCLLFVSLLGPNPSHLEVAPRKASQEMGGASMLEWVRRRRRDRKFIFTLCGISAPRVVTEWTWLQSRAAVHRDVSEIHVMSVTRQNRDDSLSHLVLAELSLLSPCRPTARGMMSKKMRKGQQGRHDDTDELRLT
ncbi:unnamed protein product [Gadus morhua 'NCC']